MKYLIHASKATLPNAIKTFLFFKNINSLSKIEKQLLSSCAVGLSSGGTHFKAVVIYVLYNINPSSLLSE